MLNLLLSESPLYRPSLSEILSHPFLTTQYNSENAMTELRIKFVNNKKYKEKAYFDEK